MEQVPLKAQIRKVLGRKVKTLRAQGLIPAHVFGHKLQTEHIQIQKDEFARVFEKVGETGIIDLAVEGKNMPVMVKGVQIHPLTDVVLHIDLYKINLSQKVKVNVPLEIIGEAPAVEKKTGLLLTPVTEIEVEALPSDLPDSIEVDITGLAQVDDAIKVSDLKVDRSKVEILADAELVVAQIGELVTREMEAVEAEAEAEAAATVEVAVGEEKTEGTEGEEKVEEGETAEGDEKPSGETKEENKD